MRLSNMFWGSVRLEITSGDISGSLSAITASGIILTEIEYLSDLCFTATLSVSDYKKIRKITTKRGEKCRIIYRQGFLFLFRHLHRRTVCILGILFLMLLTVWIPRRILFIQVEGNDHVSLQSILNSAQSNGVYFGCIRSELRSDEIKNKIIEDIPQLDWVGITTQGCVATIRVSEKQISPDQPDENTIVSSIVAVRDGIVESVTSTKGTILCKSGCAVYEGQTLISGYEDCGRILKGFNAQGEVYANTFYNLEAISPRIYQKRTELQNQTTVWSLQIGKKFINFAKDSGISPISCVKIYEEKYLTLPGGFQLPVCLIRQDVISYDLQENIMPADSALWMTASLKSYLQQQMLAGEITFCRDSTECLDKLFYMNSRFSCIEQIGVRKIEESWKDYGKDS